MGKLHQAVTAGNAAVKKALAGGADVDERDREGATPLFDAYRTPGVAKLLLDAGADVDAIDNYGATAMMRAFRAADGDRKTIAATTKLVLERDPDLEIVNPETGETSLYYAVRCGYLRHIKLLVPAGARCDVLDGNGRPLLVAAVEDQTPESSLAEMKVLLTSKSLPGKAVFEAAIAAAEKCAWPKVVTILKKHAPRS